MRKIRADLHLHTCLSPCGELEMLPTAIVKRAKEMNLDLIAICDHNTGRNALAVAKAGERESLPVIPGMEITSREEVHVLGLFREWEGLERIQALVDERLSGENDAEAYGLQVVVDEADNPVDLDGKLLIGATDMTVEEVVDSIHRFGGVAVASHIDREGFGIIGQLGFIPPGLALDALEVSSKASLEEWRKDWSDFPVVTSSDAHRLPEIGKSATSFLVHEATLEEIAKALAGTAGRRLLVH